MQPHGGPTMRPLPLSSLLRICCRLHRPFAKQCCGHMHDPCAIGPRFRLVVGPPPPSGSFSRTERQKEQHIRRIGRKERVCEAPRDSILDRILSTLTSYRRQRLKQRKNQQIA